MNFRTEIAVQAMPFKLDYGSKMMFVGSCFSDNISQKLQERGFTVAGNPFGVLYNPISIQNGLSILMDQRLFKKEDLIQHQGLYHSFYHHSRFSGDTLESVLEGINQNTQKHGDFLKTTDVLFITYGTAYVYEHIEQNRIVSNCHKIPSKAFHHTRLEISDIVSSFQQTYSKLRNINPNLKIVFTVSPVRHWKNGAHENQLSKAILLLAIDQIIKQYEDCFYFPSYELIMDDLRDYRFYKKDLLHINNQAIDYIFEAFSNSFFSKESKQVQAEVMKLKQALNHKAFNPESEAHKSFLIKTETKITNLKRQFPDINF